MARQEPTGHRMPDKKWKTPIRLVLADDHPIVLAGLERVLHAEKDFEVLALCCTAEETLKAVITYRPDVLILEILIPGDGLSIIRKIKKERLPTRIVIHTTAAEETGVLDAIRLGAQGVVLKEMATRLLLECIRKVHANEQWLERRSTKLLLEKLLRREAGERDLSEMLTTREVEIVRITARGLSNKEIAAQLSIAEGTVKLHLHNVYQKLRVDSRIALTLLAQKKGLV